MGREMNVLGIMKSKEHWIFLYDDESYGTLLRQLMKFALDPELSFTWRDAAVICRAAKRLRNREA